MFSSVRSRIGVLAGVCVAGAILFAASARHGVPEVRPGTTVFATRENGIRAITYRAGTMILSARRIASGSFAVQVAYSDGRAAQQCHVSPDLAGLLPDLSEIDSTRQLTPQQLANEFPLEAGIVTLEDDVEEPTSPFTVRMPLDRSAVALVYGGVAIEADMKPDVFSRLGDGCTGLGAGRTAKAR